MSLLKAIETITFENGATLPPRNDDFWRAVLLGREALKHIQANRRINNHPDQAKLPGETEE